MTSSSCAQCSNAFPSLELVSSSKGKVCTECREVLGEAPTGLFTGVVKAGAVAAIIPFIFHFGTSSQSTVNGEVVVSAHRDFVGMAVGPIALVLGVMALMAANKANDQKGARLGIAAGIAAAGLFHALRGFGVI